MITLPGDLVFLRPGWLAALVLLPLLALAWRLRARGRSAWRRAVDAHLLPHLLEAGDGRRSSALAGMAVLAGLAIAILALAGPSWRSVPQPMQAGGDALVLALDLSSATLATDLPPSRLAQARARLAALLREHAGEVALVVYADDAHVVSPMTVDPANVAVFLDALAPDIMPVDGQRPGRAIDLAIELLEQAGHARGRILLLAPAADVAGARAAARAAARGHEVSVLAMGTPAGSGFRGRDGGIHRSVLDMASLSALAAAGGGHVHAWDAAPAEVLAARDTANTPDAGPVDSAHGGRVREDGGYWLLPIAMLLLLAAFRRGGALAMLAFCVLLPMPYPLAAQESGRPATAANQSATAPAATPWRRADQAAHARSVEAEAAYRRGDFAAAARAFAGLPGADAAYNRGNALARAGRYEEALAAYDAALRLAPGMQDAIANRAAVQAAMQREPPPAGGGRGGDVPPDGGQQGRGAGQDDGDRGDDGQAPPDDDPGREPDGQSPGPEPPPPPPDDAEAPPPTEAGSDAAAQARQDAADQAQREAMQRALESAADNEAGDGEEEAPLAAGTAESTADDEREQANAAWLRRVPDDPGALLRARFRNEHLRRRAGER